MAASAPISPLRQIVESHLSQLSTEVETLFAGARDRARRDLAEQLNAAARRMIQAGGREELAAALVDAAGEFAAGAAFLRIEGDAARGERIRGAAQDQADSFSGVSVPLASAAALAGAVESRDPVTAAATETEVSAELLRVAGMPADGRASIFPLPVRGNVRALLYAWGGVNAAAMELLCQIAAAVWAGMEAPPAPAASLVRGIAEAAKPARPTWESLPPEEQQLHLKAQRLARVRIAEMRLHEARAVETGRARRDLYGALRERLDAARAEFRENFFAKCPSMVDYLHVELVRTLANDDAELLGKDYPGPLV